MSGDRTERIAALLDSWMNPRVSAEGRRWLDDRLGQVASGEREWLFFASFSAVPRYLGKAELALSPLDLEAAAEVRPHWDPSGWSVDQAGRTLIVLRYPHEDAERYRRTIEKVFQTADVRESVALYQALPLLPHAQRWRLRAAEGVRSNMAPVFESVALRNPYPAECFDEAQWNQMVLKAVFVGSPLGSIHGLDQRANPELARMLVDFARERRAASRPVPADLWRLVRPFSRKEWLADLAQSE